MTDVRTSSATITRLKASLRKAMSAGILTALSVGVVFGAFQPTVAHAAAPQGTLTGTVQTLTVGTTAAMNSIVVTDFGTAEITALNDIKIRIPSTVNATWDTSDTTAVVVNSSTGVTSTTVSYADANKTVVLNVTTNFANSETLTVSGLSYIPSAASTAVALDWAIDGSTFLAGNANTAITVVPAALTSTDVTPGSSTVGTTNTATVTFTNVNTIPADGKVKVTFGAGFDVSGVSASGMACSTMTGGTTATGVSGQVVTFTRTGGDPAAAGVQTCTIAGVINPVVAGTTGTYTITTTNTSNAFLDTDAAVTADTMFAASSTSNAAVTSTPLTYDVAVSAPEAATAYGVGDEITVTWSTNGGTGTVAAVNLDYSTDGGSTFTNIATGVANDGSYTWTAPSISAQSVTVRVQATDLLVVLDTDTSDAFSIGTGDSATPDMETPAEDVDTSAESTTLLPTGTFMKGASWTTVYYVDGTTRRPFLDSQTYFTYATNFDAVIDVADDYLANYSIGTPMLPMAGTVLVKVQSVNKVYALGEGGELRWVSSEYLASSLYGSNWADYVIDVPVTAWGRFTVGDDITSVNDITVDRDAMQTRNALNSMSV